MNDIDKRNREESTMHQELKAKAERAQSLKNEDLLMDVVNRGEAVGVPIDVQAGLAEREGFLALIDHVEQAEHPEDFEPDPPGSKSE